jgi:hypothetical protein
MEIARKKSYTMGLIDWSLWIMLRFITFVMCYTWWLNQLWMRHFHNYVEIPEGNP